MERNEIEGLDLLQLLGSVAPLSEGYHQRMRSQLVTEHFPARHLLLHPGEICRRIYFVSSGLVRVYHTDNMGRERTIIFMGPGELAIDANSFYEQLPATEFLETLQETTIQSIGWQELNALYADFVEGNYIGRIMTQKYLVRAIERNMELMTFNLNDRYENLIRRYPYIEQQASQAHIASYLNTSRETLSRMKAERFRNKISDHRERHSA